MKISSGHINLYVLHGDQKLWKLWVATKLSVYLPLFLKARLLTCREAETVSGEDLAEGLRQLGYHLRPHEMRMLAEQVDLHSQSGAVSKSAFLASQIDWHQEDLRRASS